VAAEAGVAGLEFLVGVPGTIGGALRMNAGAYGTEMKDVTMTAEAIDAAGRLHRLTPDELGFTYRHSAVGEDWIFLSATLSGRADAPAAILARMRDIQDAREASQPIRTRTGGSTFANPTDANAAGRKAWQLIDEAGCRGLRRGGAMVSDKHCNFLINTGTATADDLESLGEEVRRRVLEATGVPLRWEIRRVGLPGPVHSGEARS
jgi:UDP-N-acetylmuramate dehydrogenase